MRRDGANVLRPRRAVWRGDRPPRSWAERRCKPTLHGGVDGAVRATPCPLACRGSAIADRLDELLALRDAVDQLAAAELPKGFGRD